MDGAAGRLEDGPRLAGLSTQLGYPMSAGEAEARLAAIAGHPDHALLVAEVDGRVAGWVQVSLPRIFESPVHGEIVGLIVDEELRSRGIGRSLLAAAETWAREKGCGALRVRSNVIRHEAHTFYRRGGYREIKTQRVFEKGL